MAERPRLKLVSEEDAELRESTAQVSLGADRPQDEHLHVIETPDYRVTVSTEGLAPTFLVVRADGSGPVLRVAYEEPKGYAFTSYDREGFPTAYLTYEDFKRGAGLLLEHVERKQQDLQQERARLEELDAALVEQAVDGVFEGWVLEGKIADLEGRLSEVAEQGGEQQFQIAQRTQVIKNILRYLYQAADEQFDVTETPYDWSAIEPVVTQLLGKISLVNDARDADRQMSADLDEIDPFLRSAEDRGSRPGDDVWGVDGTNVVAGVRETIQACYETLKRAFLKEGLPAKDAAAIMRRCLPGYVHARTAGSSRYGVEIDIVSILEEQVRAYVSERLDERLADGRAAAEFFESELNEERYVALQRKLQRSTPGEVALVLTRGFTQRLTGHREMTFIPDTERNERIGDLMFTCISQDVYSAVVDGGYEMLLPVTVGKVHVAYLYVRYGADDLEREGRGPAEPGAETELLRWEVSRLDGIVAMLERDYQTLELLYPRKVIAAEHEAMLQRLLRALERMKG